MVDTVWQQMGADQECSRRASAANETESLNERPHNPNWRKFLRYSPLPDAGRLTEVVTVCAHASLPSSCSSTPLVVLVIVLVPLTSSLMLIFSGVSESSRPVHCLAIELNPFTRCLFSGITNVHQQMP